MQTLAQNRLTPVMTGSPIAYIKEENDDYSFNPHKYMAVNNGFNMNQQFGGHFPSSSSDMAAVNPSELTMSSMPNQYGSQMSSSYMGAGNSGFSDDELLELGDLNESTQQFNNFNGFGNNANQNGPHLFHEGGISVSHEQSTNGQLYSHTPDTNPISSPLMNSTTTNIRPCLDSRRTLWCAECLPWSDTLLTHR